MIKSTANPQEQRLPRPEDQPPAPPSSSTAAAPATPTHQVATVIANMDTLKTAFLPNLSMDPSVHVTAHYCPMCHQQFERAQHAAEHMQVCHGITLNAQGAIANLEGQTHPAQQHLKPTHACFNCDEKFGNAVDLDEHHRLAHQTAFLARCLMCNIYGIHSATQQPNEYKCTHCGSICTTAMLAAGQPGFMEQQEAPVTPDDQLPAMAPRDMRLTPEEQHHQQQLQAEHHHQQQQQQQQQELLEQQQREMQEQAQQQQQVHHHQQDQDLAGDQVALKVPPLTVKLNKNANGAAIVAHPQVIIKEEPLSLSDSGDVVNAVPVYAIQANPGVPAPATSGVLVGTQTVPADLAHKIRHKCPDCPKTFKTPGTLAMHRKIHTGEADATPKERPYTCSYCGKSFTQSNTLKQHTRIHTGEKPFHCGYCEKSFSVKDYLTKHIRTHTGEKPYTCPYCDKRFTQRSALTVHTTKLHPL
ncbi:LOW QUALITY PROTEIN: chorion transcription factor Cf2 [Drosophila ficusphila]|uniref:LOW QUALITY PROTEIN: chorion transcription factor Cf2 n=1 Tax=Drosophila ficusphila TaxID=30025 RepID=UPI0007E6CC23|nr:LOW QUALITY PROTEIN: chorion transcription factor Cf2 [Drosophila ficusphila]